MFRKIQSSIFSYFFTIVILALFVLVVVVNSVLTRFETKAVEERLEDVTLAISDYLKKTIESEEKTTALLAKTLVSENIENVEQLYADFLTSNLKKINQHSGRVALEADTVHYIINNSIPEVAKKKKEDFLKIQRQLTQFQKITNVEDVLLIDDQKVLASANSEKLIGASIDGKFFQSLQLKDKMEKVEDDLFSWMDLTPYYYEGDQKRVFLLVKVPHIRNRKVYLLYVYNPNKWQMNRNFANVDDAETADIYLIGKDGKLRSNTRQFRDNPSAVLLMLSQQGVSEKELAQAKKDKSIIGLLKVAPAVVENSKKNVLVMTEDVSVNGINALFMTHWVRTGGLNWYLVIEWGKEEAFAEWYKVRFYLNALLFIIGVFFLMGVVYGGRKLARPVYALKTSLDDLVDSPLTFDLKKYEEMGISTDMLQKMDVISREIKKLHEDKRAVDIDLQEVKGKLTEVDVELENSIAVSKEVNTERSQLENALLSADKTIHEHLKSVKRVLKLQMYNSSLYQLSLENFFHMHSTKGEISGDFICTYERDSRVFFFLGDTGKNDLKAALARMVITSIINEVVNVKRLATSSRILEAINKSFTDLKKKDEFIFDVGLKLSVCVWDRQKQMLEFAGAGQSVFVLRDESFEELSGDDVALGQNEDPSQYIANTQYIPLNRVKNLQLYLFTDGLILQENKEGQPFTNERLKELLIDLHVEELTAQKEYIEKTYIEWKSDNIQTDDASILGIKLI